MNIAIYLLQICLLIFYDTEKSEAKFFEWLKENNVKPGSGEIFVKMLQNFANNEDIIQVDNFLLIDGIFT